MQTIQEVIVNAHIADLRREAESLRTERPIRRGTGGGDGASVATGARGAARRASVWLGHWLIGVGIGVSGSPGDAHAERAGRTA